MLVGMALLGGAGGAAAHDELIGSDPPEGTTVASSPARVQLLFNLPVRPGFSTVTVTGPDRTQWQAGAPAEDGATVTSAVRPLGPAGQYTIAYQVLSADGHPVRGAVHFTLATPGPGVAAAQSQPGGPVSSSPGFARTEAASTPLWPWLVGGAVLVAAGAAVALRIGRRG